MKKTVFLILSLLICSGCGAPPPGPTKPTPTPAPQLKHSDAESINKPVNVSFSKDSKEWPVGWQWIDPQEKYDATPHDVKKGVLRIKISTKKDLYGDNRSAPRYVKAITGDFQIETRVKFLPKENYQGAGLLIFKDANNYIRFERAYGGVDGATDGIRMDVQKGADFTPIVTTKDIQTDAGEVDLKLVRSGRIFTAFWRLDEESEWREAGEFESDYPDTILAGLVMCNTAREVTAEFGYIRLLPTVKN